MVLGAAGLMAMCTGTSVEAASAPTDSAAEPTVDGTVVPVTGDAGGTPSLPVATLVSGIPAAAGPLVVVPAGCAQPQRAVAVFDGEVVEKSIDRVRFRVERLLAGSVQPYAVADGVVDVVYGDEAQFLTVGERYIVGAGTDETTLLISAVRDPRPLFGGDAVIGLDDSDIDCPSLDDPIRTLHLDGTPVEAGLITPLKGSGRDLLWAILTPLGIALGALVALVLVKYLLVSLGRAVRDA